MMQSRGVPVLTVNTKREVGKKAQAGNIAAGKVGLQSGTAGAQTAASGAAASRLAFLETIRREEAPFTLLVTPLRKCLRRICFRLAQAVADIIRTTLGPRSMLKMLLDASGGGVRFCRGRWME